MGIIDELTTEDTSDDGANGGERSTEPGEAGSTA
jgi:hypothetical protein